MIYILLPKIELKQEIIDLVKKDADKDNKTIAKEMRDKGIIEQKEIMQYVLMDELKPYRKGIKMERKLDDVRNGYNIKFINKKGVGR